MNIYTFILFIIYHIFNSTFFNVNGINNSFGMYKIKFFFYFTHNYFINIYLNFFTDDSKDKIDFFNSTETIENCKFFLDSYSKNSVIKNVVYVILHKIFLKFSKCQKTNINVFNFWKKKKIYAFINSVSDK